MRAACWVYRCKRVLWLLAALLLGLSSTGAWAQARFIVSLDGSEVADSQTGLVWRRCSAGQSYSGGTCTGTATPYTHDAALAYAKSQTGWRLPNVKELTSILDIGRNNPSIDPTAFPATPATFYWSSSPAAGYDGPWVVLFYVDGVNNYVGVINRNKENSIRLVR